MSTAFFDVETGHPVENDFAYKNNVVNAHISIRMGMNSLVTYSFVCL